MVSLHVISLRCAGRGPLFRGPWCGGERLVWQLPKPNSRKLKKLDRILIRSILQDGLVQGRMKTLEVPVHRLVVAHVLDLHAELVEFRGVFNNATGLFEAVQFNTNRPCVFGGREIVHHDLA